MQLVERHMVNKNNQFYKELDSVSFMSKNLYNKVNYLIRQDYFQKLKDNSVKFTSKYLDYVKLFHIVKTSDEYKSLPAKVSNSIIQLLDKNWKSFVKSVSQYYKTPEKYKGRPKLPQYKDPNTGRNIIVYDKQALLKKDIKNNLIGLSKTNVKVSTLIDFNKINQIRVVPDLDSYIVEVVYTVPDVEFKENNKEYLSIDIGLNNLATCVTNTFKTNPFIINGKPLKSINQYYNKKLSEFKGMLGDLKTCKRIKKLTKNRNNKISDYLHKSSRYIINQLVSNNINTLIVGKNKCWKQDIKLGKRNNQNFVSIPHNKFISMLEYKCKLNGINFILTEESYTSKCSFIDDEPLSKQVKEIVDENGEVVKVDNYKGRRVKRGLFKSAIGLSINADINGALNIMRKVVPEFNVRELILKLKKGIEGLAVNPSIINFVEKKFK